MGTGRPPPPQLTWEDLEAVLMDLSGPTFCRTVMPHFLQGVEQAALLGEPRQFLKELVYTGLILDRLGASDTGRRQPAGSPA